MKRGEGRRGGEGCGAVGDMGAGSSGGGVHLARAQRRHHPGQPTQRMNRASGGGDNAAAAAVAAAVSVAARLPRRAAAGGGAGGCPAGPTEPLGRPSSRRRTQGGATAWRADGYKKGTGGRGVTSTKGGARVEGGPQPPR